MSICKVYSEIHTSCGKKEKHEVDVYSEDYHTTVNPYKCLYRFALNNVHPFSEMQKQAISQTV